MSTSDHDEKLRAARLAAWLDAPAQVDPPDDLDEDVLGAVYLLRPDLAPAPRVTLDDIFAGVTTGPFAAGQEVVRESGVLGAEGTLPRLAPEGPRAASVGRERAPEGAAEPGSASDRPRPRRSASNGDREGGAPSATPPPVVVGPLAAPGAVPPSVAANDTAGFGAVAPAPRTSRRAWWASPLVGFGLAAAAAAAIVVPGLRTLRGAGPDPAALEQAREDAVAAPPPGSIAEAEATAAAPVADAAPDAAFEALSAEKKAEAPPRDEVARGKAEGRLEEMPVGGAAGNGLSASEVGSGGGGGSGLGARGGVAATGSLAEGYGGPPAAAAPKVVPLETDAQGYGSKGDGRAAGPWRAGDGAVAPVLADSAKEEKARARVAAQDEATARFNDELATEKEAMDARSEVPRDATAKPAKRASSATRAPSSEPTTAAPPSPPTPMASGADRAEAAPPASSPAAPTDCAAVLGALPRDGRLNATQAACVSALMNGTVSVPGIDRRGAWRLALRDAEVRGNIEVWRALARRYLTEIDPSDAEIARKLACPSGPTGCAP